MPDKVCFSIFKAFFLSLFLFSCSTHYTVRIKKVEDSFFQGDFEEAVDSARGLVKDSSKKDRLLYLMEVGIIFHTQGNYEKSNQVFKEADMLAETISKSVSKEILAFLVNDYQKNFVGENFERVLIKFYISLNYILTNDFENAKRYFRKLNYDLKNMKFFDSVYKQNLLVRYFDAIVSELQKDYNSARVQYKNIRNFKGKYNVGSDRYVLAIKENYAKDIQKYKTNKKLIRSFDHKLKSKEYHPKMGELVFIHQAGKSVVKQSRGPLLKDKVFAAALLTAIRVALIGKRSALSATSIMSTLGPAENPIPVYKYRGEKKDWGVQVHINQKNMGNMFIMNNFSETAIKNYNENYSGLISKNIASIATKIVASIVASNVTESLVNRGKGGKDQAVGVLAGLGAGLLFGLVVGSTIKPDLRCWRLIPSHFAIKRIFLEPGEYDINIIPTSGTRILTTNYPRKITIRSGEVSFINVRTF